MAEPLGSDFKSLSDIWTAIVGTLIFGAATGIYAWVQHIVKRKEAIAKPMDYDIVGGQIADMRPARKLVNEIGPQLEAMYERVEGLVERADMRGLDIKGLGDDHRELLRRIEEALIILKRMEEQGRIDKAVREDRERRIDSKPN